MSEVNFEELLVDSSRVLADMAVEMVRKDPDLLETLYSISLREEGQLSMRAARVFDLADEANPGLAKDFLDKLYEYIPGARHRSVQRCFMRTLSRYPLTSDEELLGVFYDFCFKLITDQSAPVAVRYYGMYFSYQTCLLEPDLKFELLPMLDEVVKHDSSGMKVRAKMFRADIIKKYGNLNEV